MNLYQISAEHQRIVEILENDEYTPELESELNEIIAAGGEKLKACYYVFANARAEVDGLDAEIKRIQQLKKSNESKMERIKKNIEAFMKLTNMDRFEDGVAKIILAKKTVIHYNPFKFPDRFVKTVSESKLMLREFNEWAKANKEEAEKEHDVYFEETKEIRIK